MTHHSDFKDLVRARMRATGQNYTSARADLLRERRPSEDDAAASGSRATIHSTAASAPDARPGTPHVPAEQAAATAPPSPAGVDAAAWQRAHAEYRTVLARFVRDGRLVDAPARRRPRVFVLLHLISLIPAGRTYSEEEINRILLTVVTDQAFWRRELVEYGYLQRAAGVYWLPGELPGRSASERQETPAWEALWLPLHLSDRS